MSGVAVKERTEVARPLRELVPLIKDELTAGDSAGTEHYRRAGKLLLEAREQVAAFKWTAWLTKNFALSKMTAWRYMRLAERDGRIVHDTLTDAIGEKRSEASRRIGAFRPISAFTEKVDTDRLGQERQIRTEEMQLHRELALELIDIGYKALATRLHPDRGGSRDAMRRLNRVREELKSVAQNRRFE